MSYRVLPTPNRKYVRALLAQLPKGVRIGFIEEIGGKDRPARRITRGHPGVLTPEGELLRDRNGKPVLVSGTPGHRRTLKNDLSNIRAAMEER